MGLAGGERQDVLVQRADHRLSAVLRHHLVVVRIFGIGHAAAAVEAVDHLVLDESHHRDVLGEVAEVFGSGCENPQYMAG